MTAMRTPRSLFYLCCLCVLNAFAGDESPAPLLDRETINLYATKAPNSEGDALDDMPAIQIVLPKADKATGASMIVCPGGGYQVLAPHESTPVGEWLAQNGITAFVLRYRHAPKYQHPVPFNDAQRAIRFVRSHATKWKLDPDRVGILGFSAGGHLAGTTSVYGTDGDPNSSDPVERVSGRPNLQVLIYPLITMTHKVATEKLLGKTPAPEVLDSLHLDKRVDINTPPAFIVHSTSDTVLPSAAHADKFVTALKTVGVKHENMRGNYGQHGFGLQEFWTAPCIKWLRAQRF